MKEREASRDCRERKRRRKEEEEEGNSVKFTRRTNDGKKGEDKRKVSRRSVSSSSPFRLL